MFVRRTYPNILTDDKFEYSLEIRKERCCTVVAADKVSRVSSTVELYFHGGRWKSDRFAVGLALEWCVAHSYKRWEDECDCAFVGVETAEAKKQRVAEEVSKIASQELELDKSFQLDSFARWR